MKKFFSLLLLCTFISGIAVFSACGNGITDSITSSDSTNSDITTSDITDSETTENDGSDDSKELNVSTNTKTEVPSDVTPSAIMTDFNASANTLYYLAYVLSTQDCYSVEAVNNTSSVDFGSLGSSQTTTYKDYKDGVMICTDITQGTVPSYIQTCYVTDSEGNAVAYRRTGSSSTEWNDTYSDTYYYYRSEDYLTSYGEFSTEMTVYLINDETIESYTAITDNGDGTYSQTFVFNDKAAWWYKYAMYTNGGLDTVPEFDSIEMTVTFDSDWQILSIVAVDVTVVSKWSLIVTTTSTTTTTFSYGESSINTDNYIYYETYFENAIPEI